MNNTLPAIVEHEALLNVIENQLTDLPTLPAVAVRINQTINDPSTSAADIRQLLASDPALTAKILRLVNSSFYGFPGKIATITHAVVILGFSKIRNLAISLVVASGIGPAKKSSTLNREAFWAHSFAVATASSLIAKQKGCSARILEEAFIGGLLHDIGKLFLDSFFPEEYARVLTLAQDTEISVRDAEESALGLCHDSVGMRVAEKWNLPASIIAMISKHHTLESDEQNLDCVRIVHAANYLANKAQLGSAGDHTVPELDEGVSQWLSITPESWERLELDLLGKCSNAPEFLDILFGA